MRFTGGHSSSGVCSPLPSHAPDGPLPLALQSPVRNHGPIRRPSHHT
jgi:hypothetical protein